MADITMCNTKGCHLGSHCYRKQAEPDPHRQSQAVFPREDNGSCEHYITFEREEDHEDNRDRTS